MSRHHGTPVVSIALPVYNGADTLVSTIESVLGQDHPDLELVISDNGSTDGTEEIGRHFAGADERVVYQRHPTGIGILNNFRSAARTASGTYVRWIGDDDWIAPDYVSQVLRVFAEDEQRVLVTTQVVYQDASGSATLHTGYDPRPLSSPDPVQRFAEMLRLLTLGFAVLDPLYGVMRRDVAVVPRRNILREDEVFAARLALAGPWGHVPAPLARRHRHERSAASLVPLLGVPSWHRHVVDLLQVRDLSAWIQRSSLDPAQRRRAHAELLKLYGRRKRNTLRRAAVKASRLVPRPVGV